MRQFQILNSLECETKVHNSLKHTLIKELVICVTLDSEFSYPYFFFLQQNDRPICHLCSSRTSRGLERKRRNW